MTDSIFDKVVALAPKPKGHRWHRTAPQPLHKQARNSKRAQKRTAKLARVMAAYRARRQARRLSRLWERYKSAKARAARPEAGQEAKKLLRTATLALGRFAARVSRERKREEQAAAAERLRRKQRYNTYQRLYMRRRRLLD